jgi:hypothetical protein
MNTTEPKYWFPAKRYGWGWGVPGAWQGRAFLVLWLSAFVIGTGYLIPRNSVSHLGFGRDGDFATAGLLLEGGTSAVALGKMTSLPPLEFTTTHVTSPRDPVCHANGVIAAVPDICALLPSRPSMSWFIIAPFGDRVIDAFAPPGDLTAAQLSATENSPILVLRNKL